MLNTIKEIVEAGKLKKVEDAVRSALEEKIAASEILATMTGAMDAVGEKFQKNEIYVPEMLLSAKTMQRGVNILKTVLAGDEVGKYGKFVIGTVQGDLHDIGKNLVAMMIESAGFEVIDLGVDVSADKFVEAYKANPDVKIVALSALLTTTMPSMEEIVGRLIAEGANKTAKIMVGGAPITAEFAAQIGADAYTPDAASAAQKAKELVA